MHPAARIAELAHRAEIVALQMRRCELTVEEAVKRHDAETVERCDRESVVLLDSVLTIRQEQIEAQIELVQQSACNGPWVAGRRHWWQFWLPRST